MVFSPYALNRDPRRHRDPGRFDPGRWATDYTRTGMRASFFPIGQGIRNCIGEGFARTESLLLLSAIAARWHPRLADGASVHPVVSSSTLVPNELPHHRDPPRVTAPATSAPAPPSSGERPPSKTNQMPPTRQVNA